MLLTAPGGGADIGGPETVTTDGTGAFTHDYPVPASATPGTGYTVTATVGAQTASDTTEVTAAATVDAAATVQAGSDLAVSGTNWPADTDVIVQLSAPGGGAIGTPQTVTTGGARRVHARLSGAGRYARGNRVHGHGLGRRSDRDRHDRGHCGSGRRRLRRATVPAGTNLAVTGYRVAGEHLGLVAADRSRRWCGRRWSDDGDHRRVRGLRGELSGADDTTPGTGYTLTATAGAVTGSDTTEVTAGDPGDVNTNGAASASASADATADGDPRPSSCRSRCSQLMRPPPHLRRRRPMHLRRGICGDDHGVHDGFDRCDVDGQRRSGCRCPGRGPGRRVERRECRGIDSSRFEFRRHRPNPQRRRHPRRMRRRRPRPTRTRRPRHPLRPMPTPPPPRSPRPPHRRRPSPTRRRRDRLRRIRQPRRHRRPRPTATSSAAATADATSEANAGAASAAQAAALADATTDTAAEASATDDASTSAAANASAAAIARDLDRLPPRMRGRLGGRLGGDQHERLGIGHGVRPGG